jgi:spermidine/putrescine transport system ATP-binding protein
VSVGAVRFERVSKHYGQSHAVLDFDLDIAAGQFVTLLGPSGCGKSTTLRLLGGFEQASAGRIFLSGRDVTAVPPNLRNVNMVFQDYALFPHLTVERNVAFGLELRGLPKAAVAARVAHLLELIRMQGFAQRTPDKLSGGQRQRVALARALARQPDVLLLDEPLGALDARLRMEMQAELKDLHEHTGKTFLMVTHDQQEAMAMSDVVVVMNAGRIEQIGTPKQLYHNPRTRFVATFIGNNNILECHVARVDGDAVLLEWEGHHFGGAATAGAITAGDRVHVAVRPETVCCSAWADDGRDGIAGRVRRKVFKGSTTQVVVEIRQALALTAVLDPLTAEQLDEIVRVAFLPGSARVLVD